MYYKRIYEYDNYDEAYECSPAIKHGATITLLDCVVKFYSLNEKYIEIWTDKANSDVEADTMFDKVMKLLSYIFALPLYSKDNKAYISKYKIDENILLSKKNREVIKYIDDKVRKFNKSSKFFYEILDLLNVAINNLFNTRYEDAFFYYFKVIERIAKQYYIKYMQVKCTKNVVKNNKLSLNRFIRDYAKNNFYVGLTEDMLNTKVDLIYNLLKMELYGSVYNKISLFVSKNNIIIKDDNINRLVKLRNKLAHGDIIDQDDIITFLGYSEMLALEMISHYFFRKDYANGIHIKSYRYLSKEDYFLIKIK